MSCIRKPVRSCVCDNNLRPFFSRTVRSLRAIFYSSYSHQQNFLGGSLRRSWGWIGSRQRREAIFPAPFRHNQYEGGAVPLALSIVWLILLRNANRCPADAPAHSPKTRPGAEFLAAIPKPIACHYPRLAKRHPGHQDRAKAMSMFLRNAFRLKVKRVARRIPAIESPRPARKSFTLAPTSWAGVESFDRAPVPFRSKVPGNDRSPYRSNPII